MLSDNRNPQLPSKYDFLKSEECQLELFITTEMHGTTSVRFELKTATSRNLTQSSCTICI